MSRSRKVRTKSSRQAALVWSLWRVEEHDAARTALAELPESHPLHDSLAERLPEPEPAPVEELAAAEPAEEAAGQETAPAEEAAEGEAAEEATPLASLRLAGGSGAKVRRLAEGTSCTLDHDLPPASLPEELEGLAFTAIRSQNKEVLACRAEETGVVYLFSVVPLWLHSGVPADERDRWSARKDLGFKLKRGGLEVPLHVHERLVRKGEVMEYRGTGHFGELIFAAARIAHTR